MNACMSRVSKIATLVGKRRPHDIHNIVVPNHLVLVFAAIHHCVFMY